MTGTPTTSFSGPGASGDVLLRATVSSLRVLPLLHLLVEAVVPAPHPLPFCFATAFAVAKQE